tara:strand:+ start:1207 stop:2250 length:1044 start_codon:yes stop_codon:yes gene_type:complete
VNYNEKIISSDLQIRDAIRVLINKNTKTLFIEENRKIIGVFTEGDFRKAILKGIDINNTIKSIVNKKFTFLKVKHNKERIIEILKKNPLIQDLPILNNNKSIKDIISRDDFLDPGKNKYKNIDVVIMAGGPGKRLDPFTKVLPKALLPLGNTTILDAIIKNFSRYNFKNFILSLNEKKNIIKSYIKENLKNKSLKIIEEKKHLGTIGSLKLIEKNISNYFFLTNCDTLSNVNYKDIVDQHLKYKSDLTILSTYKNFELPYGVFNVSRNGDLISFKEKPNQDHLINCGIYFMNKNIIKMIPQNKRFDADQFIEILLKKKKKIKIFPIAENAWKDYGIWKEYFKNIQTL